MHTRNLLASTAVLSLLSIVPSFAQEVELPEIEVVTPSPVSKPAKKKAASTPTPGTSSSETADAEAPEITSFPSVPGSLIVTDPTFVSVTVATEHDLKATRGATLTHTLQNRPGITGSNFAAGANRPIVRGLDNNRVRVQENGIGSHDVSALSEDHAVPIDPNSAERVEVVRGPATLRYGSQAIGGVVNAENGRIPTAIPAGGITGSVSGGFSSVDDGKDGAFKVTAGGNGFSIHADGFERDSKDYDTPLGHQLNTFVENRGGAIGGSFVWSNGYLGLSYVRFESLYGIPGEEAVEENKRIDMEQDKVLLRGEWRVRDFGIEAIRGWFGASDYTHDELVDEGEVGANFANEEQEGRIEIQHLPIMTGLGELRGAAGIHIDHRELTATSFEGDNLLNPNTTDSAAGFIFEELQATENLRLQAAARIEENRVEGSTFANLTSPTPPIEDFKKTYHPFSASSGALYELPMNVIARFSAQYVERAPDAGELFSKGVHEATETFEIGDPNLTKEKATTFEIGFKRPTGALRYDVAAYYTEFDGFIFKELTGRTCGDDLASCVPNDSEELNQVLFKQRDATFYGAEFAAEYDVASIWLGRWGISGQYDFVRAELDGGENVPRIPPHRLGGGVYYRDANWAANVNVLRAFSQDQIGYGETETGGYTLLGAEISYTARLLSGSNDRSQITVGLKGENLLDDEVRNHVSFKKDEVLEPGASVKFFGRVQY
jgi:iron complex outermembrane recepter protein